MDLNLLLSLDVLLREQSVSAAARRLGLSAPATSRILARAREAFGDALLVRAGQRLVLTPRALELRAEISRVVQDAQRLVRADNPTRLRDVERTLNIRAIDLLAGVYAQPLSQALWSEAPGLTVCFLPQGNKDVADLREGSVDLELGVIGETGPEIKVQAALRRRLRGRGAPGPSAAAGQAERPTLHAAGARQRLRLGQTLEPAR